MSISGKKGQPTISAETQKLVERMMKEAGVNHKKAQTIKLSMETMGTLPQPHRSPVKFYQAPMPSRQRPLNPMNCDRGRKTLSTIEAEVTRDPVRRHAPVNKGMNRDLEKERLARHMQFEGDVPAVNTQANRKQAAQPKTEEQELQARFSELMSQVDENQDFLEQMGGYGLREKYRHTVSAEIEDKLREMNEIDARLGLSS